MFNFFIVLLLLVCDVCSCDACKCLHGLGICVWFYPNKLMMKATQCMLLLWYGTLLTERETNVAEQQRRRGRNPFSTMLKS